MGFGYAVYFTERARNRVIRWDPDSGETDVVAGEPADGQRDQYLSDPYGLAMDTQGRLHVSDKHHHRICGVERGALRPLPLRDSRGSRAPRPNAPHRFSSNISSPTGLFAETSGSLLCAFVDDYTIYRIQPDGDLELVLGIPPNRTYLFTPMPDSVPAQQVADAPIYGPTAVVSRRDGTIFFIERMTQTLREYHPSRGLRCVFPTSMYSQFIRRQHAPDLARTKDYHPAFPSSLALDSQDTLYLSDVRHGAVLKIDPAPGGEIRKVIEIPPPQEELGAAGISGLAFGPDGTAWILNSRDAVVEAFDPTTPGRWKPLGVRLTAVKGSRLGIKSAGAGIVAGN